jgi:RND family efflux transporter MFP subunit
MGIRQVFDQRSECWVKAIAGAAAGLLVLHAAEAGTSPPADSSQRVPTALAHEADTAFGLTLDGVIQPIRQATVSVQVAGNVLALNVKAGDRVKAGQALARVDERDLQAGLQRTEAGVAQAEAEFRNARMQHDRNRELRAQGFVSQAALDVSETQMRAAQAGLAQAQAGRARAALARGFSSVAAPFDAIVLATHVEAGDLASPGRPIATVYAPGFLRAVVQVPASMAVQARQARDVRVLLADGRSIVPVVRAVLPSADPVSQTTEWRLDLPAELALGDAAPSPGQSVRITFSGAPAAAAATSRVLSVPSAALLRRGELTAVYVVRDQGFVLRAVRAGVDRGVGSVEVLAGLKPGERYALDAVKAGLSGATPAAQ